MEKCSACGTQRRTGRLFCQQCGKAHSQAELKTVRMAGFVGVQHSTSPAIENFLNTGDPAAFAKPGAKDYVPGLSAG